MCFVLRVHFVSTVQPPVLSTLVTLTWPSHHPPALPYRSVSEFCWWLCDMPFIPMALMVLVCAPWRARNLYTSIVKARGWNPAVDTVVGTTWWVVGGGWGGGREWWW